MVFSSMVFLWLFLPVVLIGNTVLPKKFSNIFLLLSSLVFYAWGEPVYIFLMLVSIIINYVMGLVIASCGKRKKPMLALGVFLNLLILVYYKYAGMIVLTVNTLAGKSVFKDPKIELPIGISFFTFQAMSYIIDVYRKECAPQKKAVNLALYISFFPQLIAGPIIKYKEVNRQIEDRQCTMQKFYEGIRRFSYGLGKKVLVSNIVALSVDKIFALDMMQITGGMAWLASLLYTFQIYYDFSGYSDMAIGLGKMFGFEFNENFHYPYLSSSIQEFWRRWHISLSTWFKEYVYIPLGGNRLGIYRTYWNLSVVFLLTGVWHGASYNFILWGIYHGIFSIIERLGFGKILARNKWLGLIYSFIVVNFGWVLFRIEDIGNAFAVIGKMIFPWKYTASNYSIWEFVNYHTLFILVCAVFGAGLIQLCSEKIEFLRKWKRSVAESVYCAALLVLSIVAIASNTYNPFIYFQF